MDRLLTVEEVSRILNVHPNTVRRWSDVGYLKPIRIGPRGDRRFREEDIVVILAQFSEGGVIGNPPNLPRKVRLNARQRQVLDLIRSHRLNKQIARELGVSVSTVSNVVRALRYKFRVESRAELAILGEEYMTTR